MAPAHTQLLGDAFLAPAWMVTDQGAHPGAQGLAVQACQQLVGEAAQVAAQGRVGVNQWQFELVGGKHQGVVGAVEMHRQAQFFLVPLGLILGAVAQCQMVGPKGVAGAPAGQMEQARHHRFHPRGPPCLVDRLITHLAEARVADHLKGPALADDGVVIDQRFDRFLQRLAAHQDHAGGIQVPDLQRQPQIHAHQRVAGALAERLPEPVLAGQVDPLAAVQTRHQVAGQGQPQALGGLHDGLREVHRDGGAVAHGKVLDGKVLN